MEKNFSSLPGPWKSNGFNTALLEAMLNSVPLAMHFLKVVRDTKDNIIDFEFIPLNAEDSNGKTGQTFLNLFPANQPLFAKLKELAATGVAFQTGNLSGTGDQQAVLNCSKFGDGILISKHIANIEERKSRITAEQFVNPLIDPSSDGKINEEQEQLNKTLLAKNRELETLNSELKTINTIASREYKETIQKLYTNLEYIVSSDGRALSDASKANIRRAQAAIQRMKLMSDDINSFLQLCIIGMNKSIVNPNAILDNVISGMKGKIEQANAHIESSNMPDLLADPLLLSFLFNRILDNSIKFRKLIAPPLIRIKHSQADEMNSVPGARWNTRYTIISVSDNGIGLNETEADKIFELFYTVHDKSRYKGSGIGLAACKKIMDMHGGFITAEGQPAHGTTVNCYFPSDK